MTYSPHRGVLHAWIHHWIFISRGTFSRGASAMSVDSRTFRSPSLLQCIPVILRVCVIRRAWRKSYENTRLPRVQTRREPSPLVSRVVTVYKHRIRSSLRDFAAWERVQCTRWVVGTNRGASTSILRVQGYLCGGRPWWKARDGLAGYRLTIWHGLGTCHR